MKHKRESNYLMKITNVYSVIFAIVIVTAILGLYVVKQHGSVQEDFIPFDDGWTTDDGQEADLKHLKQYGTVCKTIPQLESDQTLVFHAKSVNLHVYIDSDLLYETDSYAEYLFGKTPGSYYVDIPIKKEYAGKQIIIKGIFPYDDSSGKISNIFLGNGIDIVTSEVNEMLMGFLLSVIMAFLGLLLISIYFPLRKQKLATNEVLYLGLFSMNIGIYLLTDCGFLNILTSRENLVHMISELWMMMIIIPLMCYLDCKYPGKNNRLIVSAISTFSIVVFIFCYISHWAGWKDYHELITLTHISYGFVIIYFTYCVIRKIRSSDTEGKKRNLTGPIFIFLGVLIDMINYKFGSNVGSSMFTLVGVLVFLILEGVQIVEKIIIQYQKGIKSQIISRLAYHDGLTDLLNRTSFMEEQSRMEKEHTCGLIAMFDVNDLKKMNDNYGHTKGDELIVTVAEAIKELFGDLGKCFRIGGDEFVLLTEKDYSEAEFLEQKKQLPDYLKQKSKEKGFPISVAVGYAIWDDKKYQCFHDFLNDADSLMYEDKKRIKAERNQ